MTETKTQQLSASGRELPKRWLLIIAVIWIGQAFSMITSYAAGFAAVWYVTEATESAWMLSLLTICAYLPQGLLSPFGGVLADKFNRRIIMIIADMGVGIISLILGFAILMGYASIGLIMIMVIARSCGQAFHGPAMMATMPMLVPEKHLIRINTLDQLLMSICSIGAPAFGILLYTVIGFYSVMFLDFFGALLAVLALLFVRIPTVRDESTEGQHVLKNLSDGFKALSAKRGLLLLIIGITIGMMAFGPIGAFFPLMTASHFNGDGYMASLVEAVFGIGMIIGSGILMIWGGGKRLTRLIAIAAVVTGILTAACGFLSTEMFVMFVILSGLMAITCSWFNAPMITIVQRNVSEEKMGRALGFVTALIGVASPIGVAAGGLLAEGLRITPPFGESAGMEIVLFEGVGILPIFIGAGVIMIVIGLLTYANHSVRELDEQEDVHAEQIPNQFEKREATQAGEESQTLHSERATSHAQESI